MLMLRRRPEAAVIRFALSTVYGMVPKRYPRCRGLSSNVAYARFCNR